MSDPFIVNPETTNDEALNLITCCTERLKEIALFMTDNVGIVASLPDLCRFHGVKPERSRMDYPDGTVLILNPNCEGMDSDVYLAEPAYDMFMERIELGLSQVEVANLIGVGESAVRNWEKGRTQHVPRPSANLMRGLYLESIDATSKLSKILTNISQLNREIHHIEMNLEETEEGWKLVA